MIIKNGFVFKEDGSFQNENLYINKDTIVSKNECIEHDQIIDAAGLYVIPGLIDVHIHGAVGHDFCDGNQNGLLEMAAYLKANGITSFCPTSMTLPIPKLKTIFAMVQNMPSDSNLAHIQGINMEGPYISSEKKGAQKEEYIKNPSIKEFEELNQICGNKIRLVTIAAELETSLPFIETLHHKTSISIGHSASDYRTAKSAFDRGASHVTHLFNAMPPFHHRDPGIIGAALDSKHVMPELICDGIHIHPAMIRTAFALFPSRLLLISDAMRACGMPDGTYELGGQAVSKNGSHALLSDGTLAGSVTNLMDGLKNAVSFGIPLADAILSCTKYPAISIGIYEKTGSLTPGKAADIVLLDKELQIVKVLTGKNS